MVAFVYSFIHSFIESLNYNNSDKIKTNKYFIKTITSFIVKLKCFLKIQIKCINLTENTSL